MAPLKECPVYHNVTNNITALNGPGSGSVKC